MLTRMPSRRRKRPQPPAGPPPVPTPPMSELLDMMALSVRQPIAELILRGIKTDEWRSSSTKIRHRVLLYASRSRFEEEGYFAAQLDLTSEELDALPRGLIVGSVVIADCVYSPYGHDYEWTLADPIRFADPVAPAARPMPVWFRPFPASK